MPVQNVRTAQNFNSAQAQIVSGFTEHASGHIPETCQQWVLQ